MQNYLFIPYEPIDSELFLEEGEAAAFVEFKRRARGTSAKCTLFVVDTMDPRGLRLLYSVRDREIFDGKGNPAGMLK